MKTMKIAGLIGLLILAQTAVFCQKKISISFDVQLCDRSTASIQWTTPVKDSFDYILEKSRDAKTWERIANISSQLSPYYEYIDLHAGNVSYYRIAQRRHEELVALSDTKWIKVNSLDNLSIWPTPANDILHIRSPFVNGVIDVIDVDGRFIRKITIIDSISDISLHAFPAGMYFIQARHGKDVLVEKFIKQQPF